MNKLDNLFERKKRLSLERDLCAEFYNLMLSHANNSIEDPEKYNYYLDIVESMEPYARETKEQIRDINRKICKILNVESIENTKFHLECEDRYGFSKPILKETI